MTRQSIGQRLRRACRLTVPAWQQKNTIHDDLLGIKRHVTTKKKWNIPCRYYWLTSQLLPSPSAFSSVEWRPKEQSRLNMSRKHCGFIQAQWCALRSTCDGRFVWWRHVRGPGYCGVESCMYRGSASCAVVLVTVKTGGLFFFRFLEFFGLAFDHWNWSLRDNHRRQFARSK